LSALTEALLQVAHGDERAVLLPVLDGEGRGSKLLVRLDGGEVLGDAPLKQIMYRIRARAE